MHPGLLRAGHLWFACRGCTLRLSSSLGHWFVLQGIYYGLLRNEDSLPMLEEPGRTGLKHEPVCMHC